VHRGPGFRLFRESAHTDEMAEDDDRPGDASSAANASWADVVVPDDISGLAADVEAYRRECRRDRRRAWQARVMSRPGILPLSIVSIALILAGIVATLLTVLAPSPGTSTVSPLPLANSNLRVPGVIGGLVPPVSLIGDAATPVSATVLRPSVLALVPAGCRCTPLLNQLADSANQIGYPLNVVAPSRADASTFSSDVTEGKARIFFDPLVATQPKKSLYQGMKAAGLTIALIQRDGRIYDVTTKLTSVPTGLNAQLETMHADVRASG
jgi:hypothetical protein